MNDQEPNYMAEESQQIIAELKSVIVALRDDLGRDIHGTGQRAVYTRRLTATVTNDLMELTGDPAVVQATNFVGRNKIITLDLASHKLAAPGKYKIGGAAPASVTNVFRMRRGG